jgi:UDP-glucuronate 4-epimerase
MNILITGVCGFVGFSLAQELMKTKNKIIGVDNINNYYSKKLKKKRLSILKKKKILSSF